VIEIFGISLSVEYAMQLLVIAFLAALFLQSGFDKVVDWRGNIEYLMEHFGKSFLSRFVTPMLTVITVLEVAAGIACGYGLIELLIWRSTKWALWGTFLAGVNILFLFTGQRINKDYVGAAVLVNYFLLVLAGLYIMT
tara:strand:- start:2196 stop:2609 length:414 start_codon:yes stop_codon:yes gene_type:complete